jgi:hypothetical protein
MSDGSKLAKAVKVYQSTQIERLNLLKKMLRRLDKEKTPFSINNFIISYECIIDKENVFNSPQHGCQTVCCAAGYAALSSEFKGQGLKWVHYDKKDIRNIKENSLIDILQFYEPSFNYSVAYFFNGFVYSGLDACEKFWDLSETQTEYIFGGGLYSKEKVSPRMVISHIDKVITSMKKGEAIKLPKAVVYKYGYIKDIIK